MSSVGTNNPGQVVTQFVPNANLVNGIGTQNTLISQGWIAFYNESIYGLKITLADGTNFYLPAGMGRYVNLDQPSAQMTWQILTTLVLPAGGNAPANIVTIEQLDPSESPSAPGLFVLAGGILSVGNLVLIAEQTINDGNATGTTVVEAKPTGASASELLWKNDGSGVIGGGAESIDNTGQHTWTIPLSSFLNVFSWDATATAGGHLIQMEVNAQNEVEIIDHTAAVTLLFLSFTGGTQVVLGTHFTIDSSGNLTGPNSLSSDSGNFTTDGTGKATVTAPDTLRTGNQEAGFLGFFGSAPATTITIGYGQNFKTHMTNIPSSITLTPVSSLGTSSVGASNITKDGFNFTYKPNSANAGTFWYGSYATVGN